MRRSNSFLFCFWSTAIFFEFSNEAFHSHCHKCRATVNPWKIHISSIRCIPMRHPYTFPSGPSINISFYLSLYIVHSIYWMPQEYTNMWLCSWQLWLLIDLFQRIFSNLNLTVAFFSLLLTRYWHNFHRMCHCIGIVCVSGLWCITMSECGVHCLQIYHSYEGGGKNGFSNLFSAQYDGNESIPRSAGGASSIADRLFFFSLFKGIADTRK